MITYIRKETGRIIHDDVVIDHDVGDDTNIILIETNHSKELSIKIDILSKSILYVLEFLITG